MLIFPFEKKIDQFISVENKNIISVRIQNFSKETNSFMFKIYKNAEVRVSFSM